MSNHGDDGRPRLSKELRAFMLLPGRDGPVLGLRDQAESDPVISMDGDIHVQNLTDAEINRLQSALQQTLDDDGARALVNQAVRTLTKETALADRLPRLKDCRAHLDKIVSTGKAFIDLFRHGEDEAVPGKLQLSVKTCCFNAAAAGNGNFVVGSAVADCFTPELANVRDGKTYTYYALDGTQWEVGSGAYSVASHTLPRTTIVATSKRGDTNPVNFTTAPVVSVFESSSSTLEPVIPRLAAGELVESYMAIASGGKLQSCLDEVYATIKLAADVKREIKDSASKRGDKGDVALDATLRSLVLAATFAGAALRLPSNATLRLNPEASTPFLAFARTALAIAAERLASALQLRPLTDDEWRRASNVLRGYHQTLTGRALVDKLRVAKTSVKKAQSDST